MMVGAIFAASDVRDAQRESSDEPLVAWVAVAVITPAVNAEASVAVPLTLPPPSVATVVMPRYARAPPWPLASQAEV